MAELPGLADVTSGSGGTHASSQRRAERTVILQEISAGASLGHGKLSALAYVSNNDVLNKHIAQLLFSILGLPYTGGYERRWIPSTYHLRIVTFYAERVLVAQRYLVSAPPPYYWWWSTEGGALLECEEHVSLVLHVVKERR